MSVNTEKQPQCGKCGTLVTGDVQPTQDGEIYCRPCTLQIASELISKAESDEVQRQNDLAQRKSRSGKGIMVFKWSLVAVGILVIIMQLPVLSSSMHREKPLRYGSYDTDTIADSCILNLWEISGVFQQGKEPDSNLICPASKKPYIITFDGKRQTAKCPNPSLHRLSQLRVSKGAPVPIVIK